MRKAKLIWGFYFVIIGAFIVLNELNYMESFPVLKLLVPLLLIPMFIDGLSKRGFLRILFPITLSILTFSNELGIKNAFESESTPWILLLATLLLGIGLNLVIPRRSKVKFYPGRKNLADGTDRLVVNSKSGSVVKYIDADNFTTADINSSFSNIKLYFDKTSINPLGAVINFDASASRIELYVPRGWTVLDGTETTLSSVNIVGSDSKNNMDKTLTLQGKVKFSYIKIYYV